MHRAAILLSAVLVTSACGGDSDSPSSPTPVQNTPPQPPAPLWSAAGTGNDVLNKPASATRLRITGSFTGTGSNFIVWCGSSLLVNEIIGTRYPSTSYSGTHATPNCTQIEIRNSTGVAWTMTEVR